MAHEINITNGKAAFMSLREPAWHGLGQVIELPVGSREAIELSGLNWDVIEQRLLRGDATPINSHKVIVRSDTRQTLGIVGTNWTPIQNADLFAWFDGLNGFADVTLETAGALGNGEVVWVLARCGGLAFDINGDEFNSYMCLSNGHGGAAQLTITPTTVRVVCANTMRMMNNTSKRRNSLDSGWSLKHTPGVEDTFKKIQDCYARTTKSWKQTQDALRFMAGSRLTDDALGRLITEPFEDKAIASPTADAAVALLESEQTREPGDERDRAGVMATLMAQERSAKIQSILAGPTCSLPGTKDTVFAAYNAVTEYIEHFAPTRVQGAGLDETDKARAMSLKRFESANFGGIGDKRKSAAFSLAMELASA